ncbi:3-methyl-2-oxobutanoate hydroxymethyltransferase [Granulicella sibirica]|uniref:Multifunctional fusion protein n=1 Tax=Granulicella sibirica TaxID=2479048 RepID=A0A4Q0T7R1_9BACT|nr:3-methyl-2-oxobutanoate hydroxymethyltransferase [Granulicella sibirica]
MSLTQTRTSMPEVRPARITAHTLLEKKRQAQPITALTAYDYPTARLVDEAGIDVILVGDSLAMAVLGHEDTLSVTLDEILHHARAVSRAARTAFLIGDMPFGSYNVSLDESVRNALRFIKEAGMAAVKIEGGVHQAPLVERLTAAEIPVVGHIGLTPQAVHRMGGYRVQGKTVEAMDTLAADALALERAGAVALVLEGIPRELAERITRSLSIPTIGIGAGPDCDGQILVFHDLFNFSFTNTPKFVRRFGDATRLYREGIAQYRESVVARSFPSDAESYHLPGNSPAARTPGMRIATTIAEMRAACRELRHARGANSILGLVPTMGAIHEGHLSLVREARRSCDVVTASIFVNPLQFGPTEDFSRYPRTFEADCRLLETAGVDLLFAPGVGEMIPANATTAVEVAGISDRLDGSSRPGHFRGVATIVSKLFHIVQPDTAFFGQKDAAQVAVLRAMVRDLDMPVSLVACPTVRDADGLALSSRNRYLTEDQRQRALTLAQALQSVEALVADGEVHANALRAAMHATLTSTPGVRLDYAEVVDPNTLEPLETITGQALIAIAAWVGETRLIDNTTVTAPALSHVPTLEEAHHA